MNIVFSNTAQSWGGGEKWMLTAAKGLRARGHNVYFAPRRLSELWSKAKENHFEILDFNIRGDFSPYRTYKISQLLMQIEADVIILNFNKDVRIAGPAAKIARVPFICARHGVKLAKDKLKYRATLSFVDSIITNTQSIKDEYESFAWIPKHKVKVIHNGIEIPEPEKIKYYDLRTQYNIPEDWFIYGLAGRLSNQKGFDILIEAMRSIKDKSLKIAAIIAGKGPRENELKQLIQKYALEDYVKMIGFHNDSLGFLKSSDAVILSSRFEGLPNTVMESMALGKIVIGTGVNGVYELIENGKDGFIIEPENPEELAAKIEDIHAQFDNLAHIGKAAQSKIQEDFSIKRMIDSLENHFLSNIN